jgi:hypothetical protein
MVVALTNSMKQNPSSECKSSLANGKISRVLWNPKIHYRFHKIPSPVSIQSQKNLLHDSIPLLKDLF